MEYASTVSIVTSKDRMVVVMVVVQAGREVVAMAREMLGGNGIISDFLVAKQFCDMEVNPPCAKQTMKMLLFCSAASPISNSHFQHEDLHLCAQTLAQYFLRNEGVVAKAAVQ